ncbi:MAG: DUF4034 domain-containing protein [Methylobacter sp.]
MKILLTLFFVIISFYGTEGLAAEKKDDAVVNFDNGIGTGSVDESDAGYEQYISSYFARYHALGGEKAPELNDFNAERDAQGHPKWFDGFNGEYTLEMLVIRLFVKEQFDDLEKLIADWNNPDNRNADGKWKLLAFSDALVLRFNNGSWDADYEIIKHWRQKYPQSASAAIAEATYWNTYAWNARGNGFANSVSQEGWKLFEERNRKAESVLLESAPYASGNPEWYAVRLAVANVLNAPKRQLVKLSEEATQRHPYYYSIYSAVVHALTPSWGGDWRSINAFIKASAMKTKEHEGAALYTRLYMMASACGTCDQAFNLFRDTKVSWPEMKKGFDDLLNHYPNSLWNLNKYASFACQAGDKATFRALRRRIC